jgi:4-cresol dehydrogenase (hydroxylating)
VGLIWVSPVLPFHRAAINAALQFVTQIFARHSFDPLVTMTAVTERALCAVVSINFDPSRAGERTSAQACKHLLHEQLENAGYLAYRRGKLAIKKAGLML